MVIERNFYLEKLCRKQHNGMVKIVTGVRRCGKTYLLFNLFRKHLLDSGVNESHIVTLRLDDFENSEYRDPSALYRYVKAQLADSQPYYVLLDEIQLVPHFEEVLNGLLHIDNLDIYVTGSNSRFLSSDIITEFRGRGDEVRLYPLSFAEFFSVYGGSAADAWQEYRIYGGMPHITGIADKEEKKIYLKNLFNQVYLADIINRHQLKGNMEIGELTDVIASSVGSLTNPLRLANAFNSMKQKQVTNQNTINSYLLHLEDAFLISKALRYDIRGKHYINTPFKYYFTDNGLRNARLDFRQLEEGHLMENAIYNELCRRYFSVDVGDVETFAKNENGNVVRKHLEVDFVVNQGNRRYYIQSAVNIDTREKVAQESASLKNINDSFKKILIQQRDTEPWYTDDGILVLSLMDFMLKPEIIDY